MKLKNKRRRFLTTAFICLSLVTIWSNGEAEAAQRPRKTKSFATLTIKASIYYHLGGVQPIPPTAFLTLDEHPDTLLSFLGEAPVASYAVAHVLGETIEAARLRINIAQERDEYRRQELEQLLESIKYMERLKAQVAFGKGERYAGDKEIMLKASATIFNSTLTREVTDNNGMAVFRKLPIGRKIYLLGMAPTRGGVVVWLFEAAMKPGNNGTLFLNNANALLVF